jgi:hypothetical protein
VFQISLQFVAGGALVIGSIFLYGHQPTPTRPEAAGLLGGGNDKKEGGEE